MYRVDEDRYNDVDFYDEDIDYNGHDDEPEEVSMIEEDTLEYELEDDETENVIDDDDISDDVKIDNSSDWIMFHLDKTYKDPAFDIDKANQLLYTFKTDVDDKSTDYNAFDTKSQIEAVRYATFFAKQNDNDAKNFIVRVIQMSDRDELESSVDNPNGIGAVAKHAFFLIFRNYIRTTVNKFYNKRTDTDPAKSAPIDDVLQQVWAYIWTKIGDYDPSISKITTFFNYNVLRGPILDCEAAKKGKANGRHKMRIDKNVFHAVEECKNLNIEPTTSTIAVLTGKSFNEVQESLTRMQIENTAISYDALKNDKNNYKPADEFSSPEQKLIEDERNKELFDNIKALSEEEREMFLLFHGFRYKDGRLYDEKPLRTYEIEERTGINRDKVRQIVNRATRKLKRSYHVKDTRGDNLIGGRGLVFDDNNDDDGAINDIIFIE